MDFKELINKTFTEDEIFELLVFEIEENFENYLGKHCHLNFELLSGSVIRITKLVNCKDADESYIQCRAKSDKMNWIEITDNFGHIDIRLTHADRSNKLAVIWNDDRDTYHHSGKSYSYGDEWGEMAPLTEEEWREGFAELAGCLEAYKKSKSKIAV